MISSVFLLVAFILLTLAIIWFHFLRQSNQAKSLEQYRDQTNVQLYYEHKAELEADFEQGNIADEDFKYLMAELNKSLLQDVEAAEQAQGAESQSLNATSLVWPSVITLFVLVFSFGFYLQTGAYDVLSEPQAAQPSAEQVAAEQKAVQEAMAQIRKLEQISSQAPDNADNWYQLGQAYVAVGNFSGANAAFDQVMRIEGPQADLFGAKAQATYYQSNQQITQQVQGFIDQALAIDALDPSTNILLGMDSFAQQDYQAAINYWQRVINDGRPNVNIAALSGAVEEAKGRLSLTGQVPSDTISAEGASPQLTLEVSVSESLQKSVIQGKPRTVFVYAIPAEGPRMPVAAVKLSTSDLPATIVLNDARAMSPQMKLSLVKSVNIFAVVSKDGSVGIKPGDLRGQLNNIDVNIKAPQALVITDEIK